MLRFRFWNPMKTTRKPYVAVVTKTIVNKTVFNLGN